MADVLCPVVVGRARELESLRAALAAARRGEGSVTFVVGEAGIGKSRLVRELVDDATANDMAVLRGRAIAGARNVALRPLAEAIAPHTDAVMADTAALGAWLPALAGLVPGIDTAAPDISTAVRGEAFVRALLSLCHERSGVLVLEDLHWADPDTLSVVEYLTDHLDRAPVICLATVRSEDDNDGLDLARVVERRRTASVLRLERLNDSQAAAMIHECVSGRSAVDVERVVAVAEGVPFLIEELLASPGVPETFADTVQQRLEPLDASTRAVLATAATLGRHFDWRLLSAATGLDAETVAVSLERAVRAQLLAIDGAEFRFRHALTRGRARHGAAASTSCDRHGGARGARRRSLRTAGRRA